MEKNEESLSELAYRYFVRKGFKIDFNVQIKRVDGKKQNIDMVLTDGTGTKTAVLVSNWDRSIGVNVIRKLSQIVQVPDLKNGILIGATFSEHSRKFAKSYAVELLSKSKMQFNMDEL
ncbi:MAG TPA: restriction endonuclease [Candidatus Deferrimicrobium sp.]|nr:restriction endonuclease [Candidatus Deferrimicrobium sp.]